MHLRLVRKIFTSEFTLGDFFIDEQHFFYTCEDAVRSEKIAGITAIPFGHYQVVITMSNRFKKRLPLLLDVPGFEGIRIHAGNLAGDTDGCILIGMDATDNGVANSKAAMTDFMPRLEDALLRGKVWIDIT